MFGEARNGDDDESERIYKCSPGLPGARDASELPSPTGAHALQRLSSVQLSTSTHWIWQQDLFDVNVLHVARAHWLGIEGLVRLGGRSVCGTGSEDCLVDVGVDTKNLSGDKDF